MQQEGFLDLKTAEKKQLLPKAKNNKYKKKLSLNIKHFKLLDKKSFILSLSKIFAVQFVSFILKRAAKLKLHLSNKLFSFNPEEEKFSLENSLIEECQNVR